MRRFAAAWKISLLVCCLILTAGCNVIDDGEVPDPVDDLDCAEVDCAGGESCYRGRCYTQCTEADDCADGERCFESACLPRDCEQMECYDDETCYQGVCRDQCEDFDDCGDDQTCIEEACVDLCEEFDCPEDQTCYRGSCYHRCEGDEDCANDERCYADACLPIDCDGVECYGGESCYHGACYDACSVDADCSSPLGCIEDACVEPCYEDSTGEEHCPQLEFTTLDPVGVQFDGAVLRAAIEELPAVMPADHGFCWSDHPDPSPGAEDTDCQFLGQPTRTGVVELAVSGLTPGTEHYARAVVGGEEGSVVAFATTAPAPTGVSASQGTSPEHVEVSWDDMLGAIEYRIYRDGDVLAVVDAQQTNLVDEEPASPLPGTPSDVVASQGEHPERIEVSWQEVTVDDADGHEYAVAAVYPDAESAQSDPVNGFPEAAPVTQYELEIDGGDWTDVGNTTSYVDEDVVVATLDPGEASATKARFQDLVRLELEGHQIEPGDEVDYRVRAVSEAGPGEASPETTGYTGGELSIEWQRSSGDSPADFSTLPGADVAIHNDQTAPEDGAERYYRAYINAGGDLSVVTDPVVGYRGVPPFVYAASEDWTVRRIDALGRQSWVFEGHDDEVAGVAVDALGNVYTASHDHTVRKLNLQGEQQWSFDGHTDTVFEVAVDFSGNVYTASADNTVRKLDDDGEQQWVFDEHTDSVFDIAVDASGYVYTASQDESARKIDDEGDEVWSFEEHDEPVYGITVDVYGFVYTTSLDETVRKIIELEDNQGNLNAYEYWSFDGHSEDFSPAGVQDVAVDSYGNVYTAATDETARKLNEENDELWSYDDHTDWVLSVAVDPDGYVYTASRDRTIRKLDQNGDPQQVWRFDDYNEAISEIAVDPGPSGAFPDNW